MCLVQFILCLSYLASSTWSIAILCLSWQRQKSTFFQTWRLSARPNFASSANFFVSNAWNLHWKLCRVHWLILRQLLMLASGLKSCNEISILDRYAEPTQNLPFIGFLRIPVYGESHFDRMSILGTLTHIATALCFYMHIAHFYKSFFAKFNLVWKSISDCQEY